MEEKALTLLVGDCENINAVYCRICHDAESQDNQSLEAPCACKGTVKFAHRGCIQRWCNEKGSTICEICHHNYEPGYTFTLKKTSLLRDRVESSMEEYVTADEEYHDEFEFADAADVSGLFCRWLALTFAFLLIVRDIMVASKDDAIGLQVYPFPLFTILIIRTLGVIIPMYMILKAVRYIMSSLRGHHWLDGQRLNSGRWRTLTMENGSHRL